MRLLPGEPSLPFAVPTFPEHKDFLLETLEGCELQASSTTLAGRFLGISDSAEKCLRILV